MESEHVHRGVVDPVPAGIRRPLWSVMIPTFNSGRYLRETLKSVLVQDPGPEVMQIEVVDDHSTADDPGSIVSEWGERVSLYRQARNVGHTENFHTCLQRARGSLVHLLHGDDGVLPGFYPAMESAFRRNPDIGAAFCRHIFANHEGHWKGISPLEQPTSGLLIDALERLASEQRIMTPSIVVRRAVYEALGGFDDRLLCSEDWEMWVRIAAQYPIWYESQALAMYRMHDDSNTGRHIGTGEDITFTCRAITIFSSYLPESMAERVVAEARTTYATSALAMGRKVYAMGDREAAVAQVRAALECSRSWPVLLRVGRLICWAAARAVRRRIRRQRL